MASPDDPQTNGEVSGISIQADILSADLLRFLDNKWKDRRCEICDESSFWTIEAPTDKYSVIPAISGDSEVTVFGGRAHVGINLICQNCGNLKLLMVHFIQKWISEHP
jgi:hypothetical protein